MPSTASAQRFGSAPTACGILLLPSWDHAGQHQDLALQTELQRQRRWIVHRARLPGSSGSAQALAKVSRADALHQVFDDYEALASGVQGGPVGVMGFGFGAYLGAYLNSVYPVHCLILRAPALYPDMDWSTPKQDLDRRDLAAYRQQVQPRQSNGALAACAGYAGDVLLVDSEHDQVIHPAVVESYGLAFVQARSISRHTIRGADHQLTDPRWQAEYRDVALGWLNDRMPRPGDPQRATGQAPQPKT